MSGLNRQQRYLVHQVHPAKLATDVVASMLSTALLWRRRPVAGLLVAIGPPGLASALLLRRDLDRWARTAAGRYVLEHMPPSMQAVRTASAIVTAVGGWRRSPSLVAAGYALTGVGWSHGLLIRWREHSTASEPDTTQAPVRVLPGVG
jgi:hypothetical protein